MGALLALSLLALSVGSWGQQPGMPAELAARFRALPPNAEIELDFDFTLSAAERASLRPKIAAACLKHRIKCGFVESGGGDTSQLTVTVDGKASALRPLVAEIFGLAR